VRIVGDGAVGRRVAQFLHGSVPVGDDEHAAITVLATPASEQLPAVETLLRGGHGNGGRLTIVTTTVEPREVGALLELDDAALSLDVTIVVGAAASPGLSTALAAVQVDRLDVADEIHVALCGTGGPACARQHHRALASAGLDWRDGEWVARVGGTGRELCWFPDPIGARDCYRAGLAEPVLLQRLFPRVTRATARLAASRRDRLTAGLPMLRPPHPEGLDGAIRVEVRGSVATGREASVMGAIAPPAVAAASVAATMAALGHAGGLSPGVVVAGDVASAGLIVRDAISRRVVVAEFRV
jgi:hypothetical protein